MIDSVDKSTFSTSWDQLRTLGHSQTRPRLNESYLFLMCCFLFSGVSACIQKRMCWYFNVAYQRCQRRTSFLAAYIMLEWHLQESMTVGSNNNRSTGISYKTVYLLSTSMSARLYILCPVYFLLLTSCRGVPQVSRKWGAFLQTVKIPPKLLTKKNGTFLKLK